MLTESPAGGLLLSLLYLRINTITALNTSGGRVASMEDVLNLEAIASGLLGVSLEGIKNVPVEGPPPRNKITLDGLEARLPEEQAGDTWRFLSDLEARVDGWLTSEVP